MIALSKYLHFFHFKWKYSKRGEICIFFLFRGEIFVVIRLNRLNFVYANESFLLFDWAIVTLLSAEFLNLLFKCHRNERLCFVHSA